FHELSWNIVGVGGKLHEPIFSNCGVCKVFIGGGNVILGLLERVSELFRIAIAAITITFPQKILEMPRHSKNNTALSFFTYAETKSLEYGTKKQRLGRDSMREVDACYLCLQRARDPVCCSHGHLYCKECILENILAQKKEILRQQKLLEERAKDEIEEVKRKDGLAKEAIIQDFERQQVKITPIASKKRSFQLDEEDLAAVSKREKEEALKKIEEEEIALSKPKLPNFWLPSLTPSADPDKIKSIKLQTMCTATNPEHSLSVKNLVATKFTETKDSDSKKIHYICPSCRKTLTNSLKICLIKPCGHVICKICVDKFVKKSKRCFVCDFKCKEKDITDMSGEGHKDNNIPKLEEISHVIVHNDESLNMNDIKEKHLGHLLYNPKEIIPPLEFNENGLLEIWIQAEHLTWDNNKVKGYFLWGTDIYCDDSDIVAALIHSGFFIPPEYNNSKILQKQPNYDLHVTIRAYPKLVNYKGTERNNYKSRSWGNHDGVSYRIENVEKIQIGEAIFRSKGSKGIKERKKNYLDMRKKAFDVSNNQNAILIIFNNEHDPCYKYSPELMSDSEYIINRLYSEVLYLENDDERYEVSYNEEQGKYRYSIVSPSVYLGDRNNGNLRYPLSCDKLEEIVRDDLDFHELSWNIIGVVVANKQNQQNSLLCIIKRMFWYPKRQG
ncbi:2966_t:CDS:10, partial [Entrophospora sp. SA101]